MPFLMILDRAARAARQGVQPDSRLVCTCVEEPIAGAAAGGHLADHRASEPLRDAAVGPRDHMRLPWPPPGCEPASNLLLELGLELGHEPSSMVAPPTTMMYPSRAPRKLRSVLYRSQDCLVHSARRRHPAFWSSLASSDGSNNASELALGVPRQVPPAECKSRAVQHHLALVQTVDVRRGMADVDQHSRLEAIVVQREAARPSTGAHLWKGKDGGGGAERKARVAFGGSHNSTQLDGPVPPSAVKGSSNSSSACRAVTRRAGSILTPLDAPPDGMITDGPPSWTQPQRSSNDPTSMTIGGGRSSSLAAAEELVDRALE